MSQGAAEVMTYDSLLKDLPAYAQRDDDRFINQAPRFVMLAENRIASEVRGLGFLRSGTDNFTIGSKGAVIAKPARWRETVSFNYAGPANDRRFLSLRAYEYCRKFWPITTDSGDPRFYADYDYNHWLIVPSPQAAYSYEVLYHERPEPLSASSQTSWTTQFAPQLLLFACLIESVVFTKDFEMQPIWKEAYDRAAQALSVEDKERSEDRAATKDK